MDSLSRLPPDCFPDEIEDPPVPNTINAILNIATDESILKSIKAGYQADEFCKCVASSSMKGWQKSNDLWYISDRLLIPRVADIRENLFCLAHNSLGHFGADKSYAALCDAYYWPNMYAMDQEQTICPRTNRPGM
jgi:Integrase zinc binding domain